MTNHPILELFALGAQWKTFDPFLFCAHHQDAYPAGNAEFGPKVSLAGRNIGSDFAGKDGFCMYHGDVVPGFPRHPHRGFETVTIVRQGLIDHSDSLGAKGRLGAGDVQWMTAGKGIVHSEMFPLLNGEGPNSTELFQIWLNLPAAGKLVQPDFTMFWNEDLPRVTEGGAQVTLVAGTLGARTALAPPRASFASQAASDLAVWSIKLAPNATWTLPTAHAGSNRALYFFRGASLQVAERSIDQHCGMRLVPDLSVPIVAGDSEVELLLLQGAPIGEPVAQHGPFVMNSRAELMSAFAEYQRTEFGGWPWQSDAPVHDREPRFARHADGRSEYPGGVTR